MSYFSQSAKKSSIEPNLVVPSPFQYNPKSLKKPVCAQTPFGSTSRLNRSITSNMKERVDSISGPIQAYSQYQSVINNLSGIVREQQKNSSAFVSKTHRFQSKSKQTPGPGDYNLLSQRKKSYNTQKILKLNKKTNVSLSTSHLKVPSIPSDHLGYREDRNNVMKKVAVIQSIQPHPGSYDIQTDLNKSRGIKWKPQTKKYSKSVAILPGPGSYNSKLQTQLKAPVSSFLSQSKRFTQKSSLKPGPGSYNVLDISKKSHSFNYEGNFNSKSKRFDINNTGQNVGPGQYYNSVKERVKAKSVSSLRTKLNQKESTQKVVQKKTIFDEKNSYPGPGQYANTQGITLKLQKQLFRKFNGTTLPKQKRAVFEISQNAVTPGPGSYVKKEQQTERQKQKGFLSHKKAPRRTEAINLKDYEHEVTPSPFDYGNFNNTIQRKISQYENRMTLTESKPFGSGQNRFQHYDQQISHDVRFKSQYQEEPEQISQFNPDLGYFQGNNIVKKLVMTNLKVKVPFGSSATKLPSSIIQESPVKFYSKEGDWIKKSHNIRSKIN